MYINGIFLIKISEDKKKQHVVLIFYVDGEMCFEALSRKKSCNPMVFGQAIHVKILHCTTVH